MVYVNGQTTLTSAMAHEMLHMNTHEDFRGKVGETINEGSTEHLALKSLSEAGVPMSTGVAYPDEVAIVRRLIDIVGERVLINAYFNGPDILVTEYARYYGFMMWPVLKAAAEAKNQAMLTPLLSPPSAATRIAIINGLLDGWVSDDDIEAIKNVYRAAEEADQRTIRTAIKPRIAELWSIGQRTHLRVLFASP